MAKMDIEIQGISRVKTLLELLCKYSDQLPSELIASLKECADCRSCEIGPKEWHEMGAGEFHSSYLEGVHIASINPILKRVTCWSKCGTKTYLYPERFKASEKEGGKALIEW